MVRRNPIYNCEVYIKSRNQGNPGDLPSTTTRGKPSDFGSAASSCQAWRGSLETVRPYQTSAPRAHYGVSKLCGLLKHSFFVEHGRLAKLCESQSAVRKLLTSSLAVQALFGEEGSWGSPAIEAKSCRFSACRIVPFRGCATRVDGCCYVRVSGFGHEWTRSRGVDGLGAHKKRRKRRIFLAA